LVGLPVVKQPLESALLELTDFPGLSAFGVFRPGKDIGSAQLVIKVQKEQIADASFSMDNYGSEYTGRYRGMETCIKPSILQMVRTDQSVMKRPFQIIAT
jgi:hemolysin activation/secretion protein